jgi:hypothetical protein
MIYLRFFPYQWLLTASALALDFSEFSLRFPGVILSTLMIPLGYWIAAHMFDRRIGLIVAAALALSFDQVEMARTARMYAPFFLVYLIAAFSIYRVYFEDRERLFSIWPILLSIIALRMHQLAYSLALIFLVAILLNPSVKRTISLLLQAGFVGGSFLAIKSIMEFYFYRGQRLLQEPDLQLSAGQQGGGILDAVLDQITLPHFELLAQLSRAAPGYIFAISLLAAGLCVWVWRSSAVPNYTQKILGLAVIILCAIHQFNLAVIVLAMMLVTSGNGLRQLTGPDLYRPMLGFCLLFAAWIGVIFLVADYDASILPIADAGLRKMVRALIDYPNFRLFWSFALERPLLAVPLALGTLWALDRISGERKDARALFLAGTFWGALFLNGILRTKYEFFRYNLHLDVIFLMLVAIGIVEAPRLIRQVMPSGKMGSDASGSNSRLMVFALAFIVVSMNPVAAALTSSRDYYEDGFLFRAFGLDRYQDFATPGEYVRARLDPADRVFVLEPREYWNYVGRVDYWIASDLYQPQTFQSAGTAYDLYLGIPVLDNRDKVSSAMRASDRGDVWILYPKAGIEEMSWISDPLKDLLTGLSDHTVYTGRDRQTVVIRIPPNDPLRETNH